MISSQNIINKFKIALHFPTTANCDILTLDIWGSSVPVSRGDHLHHQTAPEAQQQLAEGTWNLHKKRITKGFQHLTEVYKFFEQIAKVCFFHFNCTYAVRRKTPSLHRSRAFLAAGLEANSTIPLPVERPRSSTMTTALSTIPNCEKASSRSSLETNGDRFFTDKAAECVANRTRRGLPFIGMSSNSAFAISARARDSCKNKKQM